MARPLVRVVQVGVAVGLLAVLWHVADGRAALGHLAAAQPLWLAAALAALTAQTVLSALRWRLTAGQLGIVLDRRTALREYYLSQIVNQALPGGVLGDAGRAVRARAQAGLLASGQAVLFERLAGQAALLLLFAGAVAGTLAVPGGFDWPGWLLPPVLAGLAGAVAVVLALALAGPRLPGRAGRAMAGTGAAFLRAVWAPRVRTRQAAMSAATALLNIAAFALCAAAVGVALAPGAALVLVPLILFTMLVPVTVSGWGLREGAAAVLLPLAGATAAEGLAASVAFGVAVLVAALPGAVAAAVATGARPVKP
ncbi:lysylphosphatidylglycerol synthase domain-containing protein [Roseicyclus persicicus]|uniref:UPF0104 family protein n=1 Tax=Roseicyclus persicicus TaxID=2650661 RepID=A0A7X6GX59_9RHOB|nr:lysylphosphatidylglycerol synthase domain-containing protein [Roseibacterium persicicum]NKX44019.1 UPF0104 family protein [Roseibacterium persicicum]